ncbi:hypothetical protein LINPERHAP2_LOCUS8277 [Linum perenne]
MFPTPSPHLLPVHKGRSLAGLSLGPCWRRGRVLLLGRCSTTPTSTSFLSGMTWKVGAPDPVVLVKGGRCRRLLVSMGRLLRRVEEEIHREMVVGCIRCTVGIWVVKLFGESRIHLPGCRR